MSQTDLLLASRSPRRRELLSQIGVRYELVRVDVMEERQVDEAPSAYVRRLASEKACAGFDAQDSVRSIPALGADTIVVLDDEVLEKPLNEDHCEQLLRSLSGRTHEVLTAVCINSGAGMEEALCSTWVSFRELQEDEIKRYWQSGEPKDKAGAYGIQGLGALFVKRIEGSYSNVVGLPLYETGLMLEKLSIPFWSSYFNSN